MDTRLLARFAEVVGPADDALRLVPAALAYSACIQDGRTWPDAEDQLRSLEVEARQRCAGLGTPREVALGLLAFLAEQGFRGPGTTGEDEPYEDPRNSLFDRVLERRVGLPICLCVLLVHLAERCAVDVDLIGFPGHFLAGLDLGEDDPLVLDPFHGRTMNLEDLADSFSRLVDRPVAPDEPQLRAHLVPTHPRLVLGRMLQNLRRHHLVRGSRERASDVVELLAILHPDVVAIRTLHENETRIRGLLH